MKFRIHLTLSLQLIHEMAVSYLYDRESPNRKDFEHYCKGQVKRFGLESCGMHQDNGYCDYTDRHIKNANSFLLEKCNDLCNGVVRIYSFDGDESEIVFAPYAWEWRK